MGFVGGRLAPCSRWHASVARVHPHRTLPAPSSSPCLRSPQRQLRGELARMEPGQHLTAEYRHASFFLYFKRTDKLSHAHTPSPHPWQHTSLLSGGDTAKKARSRRAQREGASPSGGTSARSSVPACPHCSPSYVNPQEEEETRIHVTTQSLLIGRTFPGRVPWGTCQPRATLSPSSSPPPPPACHGDHTQLPAFLLLKGISSSANPGSCADTAAGERAKLAESLAGQPWGLLPAAGTAPES